MASHGAYVGRGAGLGGGDSPPRPPVFCREAERRKFNRSEGARKRSARWTNWGVTPPGKLAKYGNDDEGSSSGGSSRPPRPSVYDSSNEEELVPARETTFSAGDYMHGSDEEDAVVAQVAAISAAEARARFRWEEADAVRQVREYEAARREERILRVKLEIIELDSTTEARNWPPCRRAATIGTAARRGQSGLLLLQISPRG